MVPQKLHFLHFRHVVATSLFTTKMWFHTTASDWCHIWVFFFIFVLINKNDQSEGGKKKEPITLFEGVLPWNAALDPYRTSPAPRG